MMKRYKAFKYRLYPSTEQRVQLGRTFGCARFVYNKMLADKKAHYRETGEDLKVTPAQYKDDYPWLREVDSLALANAQLHLQAAFKNFFENPSTGYPVFKKKSTHYYSYTTNMVGNNIKIQGSRLKLPKTTPIRIILHRPIPDDYKVKSVTVTHDPAGRYFASILCEYEYEPVTRPLGSIIGLDYSMTSLYVDSNGDTAAYPKYYRQSQAKLAREQRKLSHMVRGSSNYTRQRIRVARMHARIADQRYDFLCKLSTLIARKYDYVGVEDLDMRAMSKSLNYGKSVLDNSWGLFLRLLAYKLEEKGGALVRVDRWFASSQLCHDCGYQYQGVKDLSIREWDCPSCHAHHDRDVNAALNIRDEAYRLITGANNK